MDENRERHAGSQENGTSRETKRLMALYMSVISWGALVAAAIGLILVRRVPDCSICVVVVIAGVCVFAGARIAARRVRTGLSEGTGDEGE